MEAVKKEAPKAIMPDAMGFAGSKRLDHIVDVPMGHTIEDCLDPQYWAHVAETLNPGDHIELRAADLSWVATLIVRMCERNYARVVLDRKLMLDGDSAPPPESIKFEIKFMGPQNRWSVIRKSDQKSVQQGFRQKDEAHAWLIEHEKAA